MRVFNCIVDDGKSIFRVYTTGKNKKEMLSECAGNGDFEKIEDVTMRTLDQSSVEHVIKALGDSGFGKAEIAIITALVQEHIDTRKETVR